MAEERRGRPPFDAQASLVHREALVRLEGVLLAFFRQMNAALKRTVRTMGGNSSHGFDADALRRASDMPRVRLTVR